MSRSPIVAISRRLCEAVAGLRFSAPVTHVYNPLEYAAAQHETYLRRYGNGGKRYVLMGMNPGPWGMAQTGVPFGDVPTVRDWMQIAEEIRRPEHEHPKRPILGLECPRVEVSGTRLWSWAKDGFGTPERFFSDFFVINYCPLVFMEAGGRNRTPDKLPAAEREPLIAACDRALQDTVEALAPQWLIGVGRFASIRARRVLGDDQVKIGEILHPSPASPAANRGWRERMLSQLQEMGIPGSMAG